MKWNNAEKVAVLHEKLHVSGKKILPSLIKKEKSKLSARSQILGGELLYRTTAKVLPFLPLELNILET